ncbi:MipA/OmpV family protein [Massilia cavernae]|uniref:MipA/OmpV family protein n=1 Tax=Massilia cavernae TaxID=2320864 RepID=A0A418XRJ2_9BURK|nr:MipA/OmpV family protein [Massilia cavernae]RJG15113.1 MipA/OmpV family protein [Massilia cavernae]
MEKLLALALAGACSTAAAQTPANNPMPDGSRDMYVGLGVASAPVYEGADERREQALPVLQAAWSNGVFISGLSAGMHLSNQPSLEFGPLLAVQRRRSEKGLSDDIGAVFSGTGHTIVRDPSPNKAGMVVNRLTGVDVQHTRLQAGGFLNYYLTPQLRVTNTLLYGSGNGRNGALWRVGLQHIGADLGPHHFVSVGVGATLANRSHNQAFFGISADEAVRSINPEYAAGGGLKDIHATARWNWSFSPSWLLVTGVQATRLRGSAADSPLTERPTNLTVSTALAYRF